MHIALQYKIRYLVYCTDLVALTEAKEILEGDNFDNFIGADDGKSLLKVIIPLLTNCWYIKLTNYFL